MSDAIAPKVIVAQNSHAQTEAGPPNRRAQTAAMPRTFPNHEAEIWKQIGALMRIPHNAFIIAMTNPRAAAISEDESDGVDVPETVPAKASKGKQPVEPEEDDEDDEQDEDEFLVDEIVDHGFEADGSVKYKVKWLGYENEEDMTWEPVENLYAWHSLCHKLAATND